MEKQDEQTPPSPTGEYIPLYRTGPDSFSSMAGAEEFRAYLHIINTDDDLRRLGRDELLTAQSLEVFFEASNQLLAIRIAAQEIVYYDGVPETPTADRSIVGIIPHDIMIPDFEVLSEARLVDNYAAQFELPPEAVRAILRETFPNGVEPVRLSDMNPDTLGNLGVIRMPNQPGRFIVFGQTGHEI